VLDPTRLRWQSELALSLLLSERRLGARQTLSVPSAWCFCGARGVRGRRSRSRLIRHAGMVINACLGWHQALSARRGAPGPLPCGHNADRGSPFARKRSATGSASASDATDSRGDGSAHDPLRDERLCVPPRSQSDRGITGRWPRVAAMSLAAPANHLTFSATPHRADAPFGRTPVILGGWRYGSSFRPHKRPVRLTGVRKLPRAAAECETVPPATSMVCGRSIAETLV
jgi:hypothetical protein